MNQDERPRMLVVDDDRDLAEVMAATLDLSGYRVITAHDGAEALAELERTDVDAILLDMRMPVMDGWEFARRLHARRGHEIPIIVVTAAENARQWAKDVDAEGCLPKPFALDDLLNEVGRVSRPRRSRPDRRRPRTP